jgi:hypothetical protein
LNSRYWENFGRKLFEFSFFDDQGVRTQNNTALALAKSLESEIPDEIVAEFLWRRQRNFDVSKASISSFFLSSTTNRVFMCVTLDDSSPYGFNIAESLEIRSFVASHNLSRLVNIHPGADEVGLIMLSRAALYIESVPIRLALYWRLPQEQARIPNYEGQSLNLSVEQQVQASGASLVEYAAGMECGKDFDGVKDFVLFCFKICALKLSLPPFF